MTYGELKLITLQTSIMTEFNESNFSDILERLPGNSYFIKSIPSIWHNFE